jgi:carboxymethylenebutenolidase
MRSARKTGPVFLWNVQRAASRLETALKINGVEHDVKEYPDAGHAFHDGATGWVMARIGMRYHEPSAAEARPRILAFFGRHLH